MATAPSITDLFNLKYPIIQAPMAGVQDHKLAAAVCNAGGLGSLPCAVLSNEQIDQELQALMRATNRPFNVNFFTHTTPDYDEQAEQHWRGLLAPYFNELGLNVNEVSPGPARVPYNPETAAVLEQYRPAVISFHFGLPAPGLIDEIKGWGSKIISSATTVSEAIWLQDNGADLVIAQGLEAGGHRGHFLSHELTQQAGTLALLPQITAAINIPVVAAGGIASAITIQAALQLGAAGVQMGTTYLLCNETRTTNLHRAALKSPDSAHTALTNVFSGRPARSIVNRVIRELGPFQHGLPPFPLAGETMSALKKVAEQRGNSDFSSLWCGQNASGCREISAGQMTESLGEGLK